MTEAKYSCVAYTDGACSGNPGPGGWGYVFVEDGVEILSGSGGDPDTTNNIMEMTGAIKALDVVEPTLRAETHITIHTDSQYVLKGITKWIHGWMARGWRTSQKEPVKNKELWLQLWDLTNQYHTVSWVWVRGHNGDKFNERADELAVNGRRIHA